MPLSRSRKILRGYIAIGQSLAMGSNGWSLNVLFRFANKFLRPTNPPHAFMPLCDTALVPSGESDERTGSNRANPSAALAEQNIVAEWIKGFTPYRAEAYTTSTQGQSIMGGVSHSMLTYWRAALSSLVRIRVCTYGIGGTQAGMWESPPDPALANLNVPRDNVTVGETEAYSRARLQGWDYQIFGIVWRQGEADRNIPGYRTTVTGIQSSLNAELRAITGQSFDPLWVGAQYSSFEDAGGRYSIIGLKELHVAREVIMTGPDYFEDHFGGYCPDNQHMNAEGYTRAGDLKAEIYNRIQILGETDYDPCVYITAATRASASADFYATYHLHPDATTLVLDNVTVTDPGTAYGFQVFVNGIEETITAVALDGTTGVKITIDNVPTHKSGAITNISVAANASVTVPGHTFVSGDVMVVSGVVGMTEFNGLQVTVDVVNGDSFTCGVNSSTFSAYVSGGTISTLNEIRYANQGFTSAFGTTNPDGYVASERARGCLRDDSVRTTSDGSAINAWALHEAGFTVTVT